MPLLGSQKEATKTGLKFHSALISSPIYLLYYDPSKAEATSDYYLCSPQLLAEHFQYNSKTLERKMG